MNAWPQGVMVVPTTPTTASQYAGDDWSCGTTSAWAAAPQSGCASAPDTTYATDTSSPMTTNTVWTRRKLPAAMKPMTMSAASSALTCGGTPNRPSAAPMPANSATVQPRLASSMSTT